MKQTKNIEMIKTSVCKTEIANIQISAKKTGQKLDIAYNFLVNLRDRKKFASTLNIR